MEVIVYTRPDCDSSRRIKEILTDRGVSFQEHSCPDGTEAKALSQHNLGEKDIPVTVIDGVPIAGLQRAEIEQAIGWVGF